MDTSIDSEKQKNSSQASGSRPRLKYGTKTRSSKRRQATVNPEDNFNSDSSWTVNERKLMLDAFVHKNCKPEDLNKLAMFIPTKTKKQIEMEIAKLKASIIKADGSKKEPESKKKTSVNPWLNLMKDIVYYEESDYSYGIAKMMDIAGKYEHPNESSSKKKPNYPRLYQFIAAALRGKDLPTLTPVENAVMVELMQGLKDKLQWSDPTNKQKVLKWKYKNLRTKFTVQQMSNMIHLQNITFNNEFPEEFGLYQNGRKKKKNSANSSDPNSKSYAETSTTSEQNCVEKHGSENTQDSSSVTKQSEDISQKSHSREATPMKRKLSESEDMARKSDSREATPKRKLSSEDICQKSDSMEATPKKRKLSSEDICQKSDSREAIPTKRESSECENDKPPVNRLLLREYENDKPVVNPLLLREPVYKPKLITLNPLCIPVGLLRFKK